MLESSLSEVYLQSVRDVWNSISSFPPEGNYLFWLIVLSFFVWLLEILFPWRKKQRKIRRDFWLDGFYMFFNMFIFPLIIFSAIASLTSQYFLAGLGLLGFDFLIADRVGHLSIWLQLLILFIIRDFIQWNVHRLLHRSSFLWQFHKVHHSVKEMGFAAHLRFHWMETVVYNTLQFLPLSMIGFSLNDYIAVYIVSILIGHLNHANVGFSYGPLKYIFNNPRMHIWHHVKELPQERKYGCNFGLSLSVWDYLFGTVWMPEEGRDIEIGYDNEDEMPSGFLGQILFGFRKK